MPCRTAKERIKEVFMGEIIVNAVVGRIKWTHHGLISVTEDLTGQQISQQPSPIAPPIGWHLFHVARWADRLQVSFSITPTIEDSQPGRRGEIWRVEGLAAQWGLDPESLGLEESGPGMEVEDAVLVASLGKSILLDYARRVFAEVEQVIGDMNVHQLQQPRLSILPQIEVSPSGKPVFAGDRESTIYNDLMFHLAHTSRHLGMIEALRGALFAVPGTASV
jgi:hypothetical protein